MSDILIKETPNAQSAAEDLEWVLQARGGDSRAFDSLMGKYKERAVRSVYVIVGNYEDAKDIAQEAFVKAYRSLAKFESRARFFTWFYRILVNTAKDYLRRKALRQFLNFQDQEENQQDFLQRLPDSASTPDERLLGAELGSKISEIVGTLPMKQRWVFALRFFEGLSLLEISAVTGVTEGSVKATLHIAVQKFKIAVQPYLAEGR